MEAKLTETNSAFKYASGSDCQALWKQRCDWIPPSEYRDDYLFKHNREARGKESSCES
jgi:hypothetical protein